MACDRIGGGPRRRRREEYMDGPINTESVIVQRELGVEGKSASRKYRELVLHRLRIETMNLCFESKTQPKPKQ
jgi:hypothetical protein